MLIDAGTGNVSATIPVGHSPCAPVLLPDGKHLFVCNRFNNDVSMVDVEAGKQVTAHSGLREPVASDATPDGSGWSSPIMLPVDPSDADTVAAEVSLIQTGGPDARRHSAAQRQLERARCVRVAGRQVRLRRAHLLSRYRMPTTQLERGWMNTNALSVIDVPSKTLVNTVLLDEIDLGAANPYAVTTSADGSVIYVSHAGTHELSIINTQGLLQKLASIPQDDGGGEGPGPREHGRHLRVDDGRRRAQ